MASSGNDFIKSEARRRVEAQLDSMVRTFGPLDPRDPPERELLEAIMDGAQAAVMEWVPKSFNERRVPGGKR